MALTGGTGKAPLSPLFPHEALTSELIAAHVSLCWWDDESALPWTNPSRTTELRAYSQGPTEAKRRNPWAGEGQAGKSPAQSRQDGRCVPLSAADQGGQTMLCEPPMESATLGLRAHQPCQCGEGAVCILPGVLHPPRH